MSRIERIVQIVEAAALDFLEHLLKEKPQIPIVVPLILIAWAIERWLFSLSNWVPLAVCVWATLQVSNFSLFTFSFCS